MKFEMEFKIFNVDFKKFKFSVIKRTPEDNKMAEWF
jgi:hypothetical protein